MQIDRQILTDIKKNGQKEGQTVRKKDKQKEKRNKDRKKINIHTDKKQ